MQGFIYRGTDDRLYQNSLSWDIFVDELFSVAKNSRELRFIGQLVEDLQYQYEKRLEDLEELEELDND